jgi:mRNA-degrading endonuclease toxin of MazEF toxin-antitoxin module
MRYCSNPKSHTSLSKITAIDKDLILGKLGELNSLDIQKINKNLIEILDL